MGVAVNRCSQMKLLALVALPLVVSTSFEPRTLPNVPAKNNEPRNPGKPLGPADFWNGNQMEKLKTNATTERMMKLPQWRSFAPKESMESLEVIGEKTVKRLYKEQRNILAPLVYHWPNGIMYYTIDAAFTDSERAIIASGITHVEENSCIRFVPRTTEHDYVDIIPGGGGCYAQVPYRAGRGRMEIGLQQNGCVYLKVVVHELLHSLGFMHEMNRPDRDSYVTMNWQNIQNAGAAQFYIDALVGTTPTATADGSLMSATCPMTTPPSCTTVSHHSLS